MALVFQSGQVIETIAVTITLAEGNGGKRRALEMVLAARVSPHHEVCGSNFFELKFHIFCIPENVAEGGVLHEVVWDILFNNHGDFRT